MNVLTKIKRHQIDEQKWDQLISEATHSLPYAYSYYLDAVAENWEVVVLNDYEAALPLVWLKKMGVKCLYQPYYCQQLGFFSVKKLSPNVLKQMLAKAAGFPFAQINLNPSAESIAAECGLVPKKNLLLPLHLSYTEMRAQFSENHRRNIAKAEKLKCRFSEIEDVTAFQKFYLQNINPQKEKFAPKHHDIFNRLTQTLTERKMTKIFAVYSNTNTLLAASMILVHRHRLINMINTSSPEGKKNGGSHFLFSNIICRYANSAHVLDFEGSSIPGIARFYEGFGARQETFFTYRSAIARVLSQR